MQVTVLNGVNLDMLGRRDPERYGDMTLRQLETRIYEWAQQLNMTARCSQTNSEGEYVDMIHDACSGAERLSSTPAHGRHYSYAIRDALEIFTGPIVEVHLSDIEQPRAMAAPLGDRGRGLAPHHAGAAPTATATPSPTSRRAAR